MTEYKQTEIGSIPKDWDVKTIDEVKADGKKSIISGPFGSNISSKFFTASGIPVIRGNNLSLKVGRKFIDEDFVFITEEKANELNTWAHKNDLLFTAAGTIGQVGILTGKEKFDKYIISNKQLRVSLNESMVLPIFAYYWFASPFMRDTIIQHDTGSTIPLINLTVLKGLNIPVPNITEQQLIVSILSNLDDKIDLLTAQNKNLEEFVNVLFEHWFLSNTEVGSNGHLGELVETTLGGEWGKEKEDEDFSQKVQCIRGTDIADLNNGLADRIPIRYVKEKKLLSIEPQEGDLVIEISGGSDGQSTGRTIYINNDAKALFDYPLVFSNFCRLIRPKKKEYMFFLYSYIQHLYNQGDFFNLENGSSGIRNFDYKAFLFELEYPMPEEDEILRYEKDVEPYFKKINANKLQIKSLEGLRDTLLPKLMSGEIRVG